MQEPPAMQEPLAAEPPNVQEMQKEMMKVCVQVRMRSHFGSLLRVWRLPASFVQHHCHVAHAGLRPTNGVRNVGIIGKPKFGPQAKEMGKEMKKVCVQVTMRSHFGSLLRVWGLSTAHRAAPMSCGTCWTATSRTVSLASASPSCRSSVRRSSEFHRDVNRECDFAWFACSVISCARACLCALCACHCVSGLAAFAPAVYALVSWASTSA